MRLGPVVAAVVTAALVTAGIATSGTAGQTTGRRVGGARHHLYTSVGELRKDATAVVVATATDRVVVETVADIPFTVTQLDVVETIRGLPVNAPILLRQLGSREVPADAPLVEPGATYLLFVRPFEFVAGVPTGQHVAVGAAAGIFRGVGQDSFAKVDPQSPDLPDVVSRRDATG
ncbi:MAG TPA: hypothetical protein VFQ85_06950 [Mycobacteriales bacterium]|jgi:hypothetical protein|nr:hypothetical protein [Mycobacteriales bacterium]